jgi:two-component sensor histidine kinase
VNRSAKLPILPQGWRRKEWRVPIAVVVICLAAALLNLAFSWPQPARVARDVVVSTLFCGFGIYGIAMLIRWPLRGRFPGWAVVVAILAGNVLGSRLAYLLVGTPDYIGMALRDPSGLRNSLIVPAAIGIVVTAFFLYFSHAQGVKEELERQRRRAAEALQAETQARLALLQAQIEPHFLFNTLANIHSLIKEDAEAASVVLEQLNTYLRTSLRRTREPMSTVGEELELVEALLGIAGMRLGRRLEYSIQADVNVRAAPLPPLLLQPLVENAVRHGIEPAVDGGRISVEVRRQNGDLEMVVTDTGVGLDVNAPGGVGLANIRARLESLYGVAGRLEFYANTPRGVIAKLLIPSPQSRVTL